MHYFRTDFVALKVAANVRHVKFLGGTLGANGRFPSRVGVLLKRRITLHTIAHGLWFFMPKISAEFKRGHSQRRRQIQAG